MTATTSHLRRHQLRRHRHLQQVARQCQHRHLQLTRMTRTTKLTLNKLTLNKNNSRKRVIIVAAHVAYDGQSTFAPMKRACRVNDVLRYVTMILVHFAAWSVDGNTIFVVDVMRRLTVMMAFFASQSVA